jgi:nucleotide-binding universal stress UspA family protein
MMSSIYPKLNQKPFNMSKIIVAIDFSECSINAFLHALSLAKTSDSELILAWVAKDAGQKDAFEAQGSDPTKKVKDQFDELIAKYQPQLPKNKITYRIRIGKVYKEICALAKEEEAMIVVTGTHGASGFEAFWIGSNANRIVSASSCPVITIREGIDIQRPLKKIVLPIDSTPDTRQKASFTGYLAKVNDSEVHILSLYTSRVKAVRHEVDLYSSQVAIYFDEEGIRYVRAGVDAENISDAMIDYAKKVDANMISIMTEQETTASNLWLGPYAQQTVNHSPIPVLSIHSKETLAAGLGF